MHTCTCAYYVLLSVYIPFLIIAYSFRPAAGVVQPAAGASDLDVGTQIGGGHFQVLIRKEGALEAQQTVTRQTPSRPRNCYSCRVATTSITGMDSVGSHSFPFKSC